MIYNISYKAIIDPKLLRIRFDKKDGFIKVHDGTRCLTFFGSGKYDAIYNRVRYLIGLKSSITYVFSHYYAKIKVDSYGSLPIKKTLILHNLVILIKSVLNKDQNRYCYNIFLEKCSYQLAKK